MPLPHRFICSTRTGPACTPPAGSGGPDGGPTAFDPVVIPAHPTRHATRQPTAAARSPRYDLSRMPVSPSLAPRRAGAFDPTVPDRAEATAGGHARRRRAWSTGHLPVASRFRTLKWPL
ncbi:hypothetical protein GCM10010464_21450 [Pseudonocardia yunnanensis]